MPKSVLIVDDSGVIRKMLARSLRQAGLDHGEIYEGSDGVEGLKQLEQHPDVGVILSDWNMPNMDGLTFVKSIRERGLTIPIIMITTEATDTKVSEVKAAGANGYVCKPFTPELLQQEVGKYF